MSKHRLFIFDPSHPNKRIRELEAEILVCDKTTWAVLSTGKRKLLGTSAFYTEAAANRAKRGALVKLVETPVLGRMRQTEGMYLFAQHQLAKFDATGKFH